MKRKVYLLQGEAQLHELVEQAFDSEDRLQNLLAHHPDLLGGDQMNEVSPRRWVLVSRETAVPDQEQAAGRWSLDHLFLDQDGIPTLVEVKRSSDPRIRREVVGQMLDYAANGVAYWPIERLQALFEAECAKAAVDPSERLEDLLGTSEPDVDAFWQQVKTNLQAGRIRLVFVADEIPSELRKVVEFLNAQMDPAEVLAVAIRQYVGSGLRTLVPQVLGQTAEAQGRKSAGARPKRNWDEASFFAALEEQCDAATVRSARKLVDWAAESASELTWGHGMSSGSCFPIWVVGGARHSPIALWTYGHLEIQFQGLRTKPPFDDLELRRELLDRLAAVPGFSIPPDAHERRPNVVLRALEDGESWSAFREAMGWYLQRIGAGETLP